MEIAPIAGIRVTPAPKPQPADPRLTAFFDIEGAARPGDDTYSAARKKAAGAEEDDGDDANLDEVETGAAPATRPAEGDAASRINYFA